MYICIYVYTFVHTHMYVSAYVCMQIGSGKIASFRSSDRQSSACVCRLPSSVCVYVDTHSRVCVYESRLHTTIECVCM